MKQVKVDAKSGINFARFDNSPKYPIVETNLATSFEILTVNVDHYYMKGLSGWFKAPADGQYRFYMSCDDWC